MYLLPNYFFRLCLHFITFLNSAICIFWVIRFFGYFESFVSHMRCASPAPFLRVFWWVAVFMRRLIWFVHFVAVVSCCPSSGRHSVAPLTLCSYSCCFLCFPSCSSESQHYFWRDFLFPIYCGISLSESNNSINGTCFWAPILLQGQSLEMHVPHC